MDGDDWYDGHMNVPFNGGPRWRGGGRGGGRGGYRNDRYSNAYGDYNGGYGPSGALGPHGGFGPNSSPFGQQGPTGSMCAPCPSGPMGQAFMWGKGFGPRGPPIRKTPMEEKTIKYLRRCGVPKDGWKNLPFDLLKLYEPQQCGLCGHTFESFTTSRMHYLSKNHAKNQKKWFSKQSDGGHRSKELPIKSRELYCELCDVHITSKTHADSHYAGKPHRSIVEGRKNPKNPTLMQRNMSDRLDQLIRREKKFLKPLDEGQENEEAGDAKPTQPELYCDICKTAVTCSEQMTMHLNGKRHLAKEKSHILKMMKGEVASTPNNDTEEAVVEVEEEEEPVVEEAEAGDDKYDWGNGSGNWEETTTD